MRHMRPVTVRFLAALTAILAVGFPALPASAQSPFTPTGMPPSQQGAYTTPAQQGAQQQGTQQQQSTQQQGVYATPAQQAPSGTSAQGSAAASPQGNYATVAQGTGASNAQVVGSTTTQISIDTPSSGTQIEAGKKVNIGGWAADPTGPGTGVDTVRVYLDGPMDGGGTLVGNATYGGVRADVAIALGNPSAVNSGFDLTWTPQSIEGGTHVLFVYARSAAGGWTYSTINVDAPVSSAPAPSQLRARGGSGPFDPGPSTSVNQYNQPNNQSQGYNQQNNQGYNNQYQGYNQGYNQGYSGGYGNGSTPYGGSFLNNGNVPYQGYSAPCNGGPCGGGPYGTSFMPGTLCPIYSNSSSTYGQGPMCGGVNPWQTGAPFMGF